MGTRQPIPARILLTANDFEFRHRSLILIAIYLLAFAFWPLDRRDVAGFIAQLLPVGMSPTQMGYLVVAVPAVLAACIGTWVYAYLPAVEGLHPRLDQLVTAGPYRFVRHPLYLGTILSLLSFACLLNRLGLLIVAAGTIAFVYRLISREEMELVAVHGPRYQKYIEAVPRLIPAARPRVPRGTALANWRDGFAGGAYLWLLAASLVVLAASLKESLFYATLMAAFATKLISVRLAGRPANAAT